MRAGVTKNNRDSPIREPIRKPLETSTPPSTIPSSKPSVAAPKLAVLPFANLSGEPEQEYFSDSMTVELSTELSRIAGLFVIDWYSMLTYKGKTVRLDRVSQELGVRYVI